MCFFIFSISRYLYIVQVGSQAYRHIFFKFCFHIWLNLPADHQHFGHSTKLPKKHSASYLADEQELLKRTRYTNIGMLVRTVCSSSSNACTDPTGSNSCSYTLPHKAMQLGAPESLEHDRPHM